MITYVTVPPMLKDTAMTMLPIRNPHTSKDSPQDMLHVMPRLMANRVRTMISPPTVMATSMSVTGPFAFNSRTRASTEVGDRADNIVVTNKLMQRPQLADFIPMDLSSCTDGNELNATSLT